MARSAGHSSSSSEARRFVFVEAETGLHQPSASDVVAPFTIASRRLRDAASAATEDSALAKHRTDQRKSIARDAECRVRSNESIAVRTRESPTWIHVETFEDDEHVRCECAGRSSEPSASGTVAPSSGAPTLTQ